MSPDYFYIIELVSGVWLADWAGDPGRSCDRGYAQRFATSDEAFEALQRARKVRAYPNGRLRAVPASEAWELLIELRDGALLELPAIGSSAARQLVKHHQNPQVLTITVCRNRNVVATWRNGRGWDQFSARQREVAQ